MEFGCFIESRRELIRTLRQHYSHVINSFSRGGLFFSPSRYATEQQPYGPYFDYYCLAADQNVIDSMRCNQLAKLKML